MATPNLSDDKCREALQAFETYGSKSVAATALGLPRTTFSSRLYEARKRFPGDIPADVREVTVEQLPAAEIPFDEWLTRTKQDNSLRIAHERAKAWQVVNIPCAGPYGLMFFGDPHMDDPYCDLDALERHARICADTPGMFGVNGGDSINNWVGRLKALYADQPTTAEQGWRLVEWFMHEMGIRWACWLLGNHDDWEMGFRIFDRIANAKVLMRNWDAKVILRSPDGDCRLWARHDFKGTSIYNELHGLKRAAMFGGEADVYAAFHRHTWGTMSGELDSGKRFSLIRARGYKECDAYAIRNGFGEQTGGQSVVAVIQPRRGAGPIVHTFDDPETGADFLTFLRRKEAA
ncbi:MAG: hypothetical protein WA940_09190 [Sphingopyxis sp.]